MARFLRYVFVICFCICLPFLTALVFLRCSLTKQPAADKPPEIIKAASSQMAVPFISQNPDFPTGCEAVSAVMALRYYGECVTVDDFVDNFLSCSDAFYTMNGVSYGPDPHQFFIGDPRTKNSYGCYAPVIEQAINRYAGAPGRVRNTTGCSLEYLCETYIDNGHPVRIWGSMDMKATRPTRKWRLSTGEEFTWISGEHCLVLVGYDDSRFYFNDPLAGAAVGYDKKTVSLRYKELGEQSLSILD